MHSFHINVQLVFQFMYRASSSCTGLPVHEQGFQFVYRASSSCTGLSVHVQGFQFMYRAPSKYVLGFQFIYRASISNTGLQFMNRTFSWFTVHGRALTLCTEILVHVQGFLFIYEAFTFMYRTFCLYTRRFSSCEQNKTFFFQVKMVLIPQVRYSTERKVAVSS